jgi:polyhydroxyalkanoate synthesis regulator protein
MGEQSKARPIVVKRYAGSRLYDTTVGRYVELDDLRKWIAGGMAVVIVDAETGNDITKELMDR